VYVFVHKTIYEEVELVVELLFVTFVIQPTAEVNDLVVGLYFQVP
jgi:hypothetical protein